MKDGTKETPFNIPVWSPILNQQANTSLKLNSELMKKLSNFTENANITPLELLEILCFLLELSINNTTYVVGLDGTPRGTSYSNALVVEN